MTTLAAANGATTTTAITQAQLSAEVSLSTPAHILAYQVRRRLGLSSEDTLEVLLLCFVAFRPWIAVLLLVSCLDSTLILLGVCLDPAWILLVRRPFLLFFCLGSAWT